MLEDMVIYWIIDLYVEGFINMSKEWSREPIEALVKYLVIIELQLHQKIDFIRPTQV